MSAPEKSPEIKPLIDKLLMSLGDLLQHDGFGEIRVEVRILKRQQKEVIIHYGKQYRFVVDWPPKSAGSPTPVTSSF